MEKVTINESYITITQFLKMKDYISSGGQAKYYLLENDIFLNNVKITERGKKLHHNDVIKIKNRLYIIIYDLAN